MDVENMHPFCLPFGSCHDATSSSATADFSFMHNTGTQIQYSKSDITKDKSNRSRTPSPIDDMSFRDLNKANMSNTRTLLGDDLIICPSLEDDSFYSFKLDFDSVENEEDNINSGDNDVEFRDEEEDDDDEYEDDYVFNIKSYSDDWYSIYSQHPSSTSCSSKQKSSLIKAALANNSSNSQVFQLMVDPIDIKSSPTLAQLNLNSNDDPTDGLWDPATTTSISNTTSTDLYSNCTSISINRVGHNSFNSHNISCNHIHHHISYQSSLSPYSSHLSSSPSSTYSSQQASIHLSGAHRQAISPPQPNCLPTNAPSSKLNHQESMIRRQATQIVSPCGQQTNETPVTATAISSSANVNVYAQHIDPNSLVTSDSHITKHSASQQQREELNKFNIGYQRSISPPQVTSSSSPLNTITPTPNDNRPVDGKLKDNIDYLTNLICHGNNKIDSNHSQQTAISSTMAKSYTTLAHSLSTGPKLLELERHPIPSLGNNMYSQNLHHQLKSMQQHDTCEHSSSPTQFKTNNGISHQNLNMVRACGSGQCLRPPVEMSISAADSTNAQLPGTFSGQNWPHYPPPSSPLSQQQPSACINISMIPNVNNQRQSFSDLKVLSSLLNNNSTCVTTTCQPMTPGATFGDPSDGHSQCQAIHGVEATLMPSTVLEQRAQPSTATNDCPNGKPITLTPISTNLSLQKPRPTIFAQPASPSASSGTNTDSSLTLTNPTNQPVKRQRSSQAKSSKQRTASSSRSGRPNSMSTDCSLSSHDEGFASQVDNDEACSTRYSDDEDDDVDSDDESFYGDYTNGDLIGASISDDAENKWTLNMGRARRNGQKRYFWQYNVQSKGPKGTRICSTDGSEDPFVLSEASDPVFSNDCQVEGVKHSGKARRGDGNDLTPNPKKLLMIGLELKKLSRIINDLAPVVDLPLNARNKTRKEKNKLASRACRLKKKAQHEANKIKLYGLQREHQQVVLAIYDIRKFLNENLATASETGVKMDSNDVQKQQTSQGPDPGSEMSVGYMHHIHSRVKSIADECSMKVAGQTSDYVNSILEKVVSGCMDGDLDS